MHGEERLLSGIQVFQIEVRESVVEPRLREVRIKADQRFRQPRQLLQDVEQLLDFAQQQRTTVRTDGATVKISLEDAATTRLNQIPLPVTGCR